MSILMMACLFLIVIQIMNPKKKEETSVIRKQQNIQKALPETLPSEETVLAQLPKTLADVARSEKLPTFPTLGSLDPQSPYRMLVTFNNRGASVARIELNERSYRDTHDDTGFLGQVIIDETLTDQELALGLPGIRIQSLGAGTAAAKAGLKVGDRLLAIQLEESTPVVLDSFLTLREQLLQSKPGQKVEFTILRASARTPELAAQFLELEKKAANADLSKKPESDVKRLDSNLKTEIVTVLLERAPVPIVRPESFVRTYNDYTNLIGLQGLSRKNLEAEDLLEPYSSLVRKSNSSPGSFLMTLADYDGKEKLAWSSSWLGNPQKEDAPTDTALFEELSGVDLRNGLWDFVPDRSNENTVVFRKILLNRQIEVTKTYQLEKGTVADAKGKKKAFLPEYHLTMTLAFRNLDPKQGHKISYILDGPNGLPMEGAWYSAGRKTGPGWGTYGLRDLVLQISGKAPQVVRCLDIAQEKPLPSERLSLNYIGVDAQYFQCTLIPNLRQIERDWLESYVPIRVGARVSDIPTSTNVSFRMKSVEKELAPFNTSGDTLTHEFQIFAGPKQPKTLGNYGLEDTVVYGWFWFVSKPLLGILHFFHDWLVFNYGIAILLLTVLVRLLMYPVSRKMIISSMKMQRLQPELTALKEKYKDDPREMMTAQQALFRKHGVSPAGGCLPMFIQLPIFIGLYKALSIDVNLYGAPLFHESFRWCSNLSAPDMLVDWSSLWNSFGWFGFNMGQGMFYLGPYFNLLPMMTIVLFLVQQKFMMPPVVGDDDAARQQRSMRRMMNFMMLFMGLLFFKVPSGLCIYFIASSLWGIIERLFIPQPQLEPENAPAIVETGRSRRKVVSDGRNTTTAPRNSKNRRYTSAAKSEEKPKGRFRKWLDEMLEKAREQQKLAKAELEKRERSQKKRR